MRILPVPSALAAVAALLIPPAWSQEARPGKIDPPAALQRGTTEEQRIVSELQTWGVPPELRVSFAGDPGAATPGDLVPVDPSPGPKPPPGQRPPKPPPGVGRRPAPAAAGPRRLALYDLRARVPSPEGRRLHAALSLLSDYRLSQVTEAQLHEALRLIEEGERRELNARNAIYPELYESYYGQAAEVLGRPGRGGAPLGLSRRSRSLSEVLLGEGGGLRSRLRALRESGGSAREIDRLQEALSAIDVLSGSKPGLLTHAALHALISELPEDALTPAQWDAVARSFPMGESISRLGMLGLWRRGITGAGVRVAVIDTGVDSCHPDLEGYVRDRRNFTRHRYREGDRAGQPDPRGRHGTHVSGIIHGLAPGVEIYNYKALDEEACGSMPADLQLSDLQEAQAVVDAMELAWREAERDDVRLVINLSLGFGTRNHLIASDPLRDKIAELAQLRVIVVVGSGNEGEGNTRSPGYVPEAVTVGSADYSGRQAPTSSRQEVLELGRDGRARLVMKPDILAYGVNVHAAQFNPYPNDAPGSEYVEMSGASMATPHVSAVVALLLQAGQDQGIWLGLEEVREFLLATASEAEDAPYGVGIVNPEGACRLVDMTGNLILVSRRCGGIRGGR